MKRTACALAVAAVICTAAYGTSRAVPIAPLTGVQAQSNNITQVYWYHHRWHPHRYWQRHYWGWRPYRPYWAGGWHSNWGWGWSRWGWWW
jgi:hypothetical protein